MSLKVTCPACGTSEAGPDHLRGKKVRCKRCKHLFVVGAPAASAASKEEELVDLPLTEEAAPESDLTFEDNSTVRLRNRRQKSGFGLVVILFLLMFGIGGGATAGLLWWTKPEPEPTPPEPEKPGKFTWVAKGSGAKEKDGPPTPREKDKDKDKDKDKGKEEVKPVNRPMLPPETLPTQKTKGIPTLENWAPIKIGQTEAEVVELLGPPKRKGPSPTVPKGVLYEYYIAGKMAFLVFADGKVHASGTDPLLQADLRPADKTKTNQDFLALQNGGRNGWLVNLGNLSRDVYVPEIATDVSRELEKIARMGDMPTRLAAVQAMKTWGRLENVPYLLTLLELPAGAEPPQQNIVLQMHLAATEAIVAVQDVRGPKAMAQMLRSPNRDMTRFLIENSGRDYGRKAALYCCNDKDPIVRMIAEEILTRFETPPVEIAEQSARDLKSSTPEVKENALRFFQRRAPDTTGVTPPLREQIAYLLELIALENEGNHNVIALDVLKRWGVAANRPAVQGLTMSTNEEVKTLATLALMTIPRK